MISRRVADGLTFKTHTVTNLRVVDGLTFKTHTVTSLRVADGLTLRDTRCDKPESCGWPDLKGHTL